MSKVQFGQDSAQAKQLGHPDSSNPFKTRPTAAPLHPTTPLSRVIGVRLPGRPDLWDVFISAGRIASVEKHDPAAPRLSHLSGILDASEQLLAPSLCHAHVHLDKCFLLQDPKYSDLEIVEGDFQEAMTLTGKAKARFEEGDLLRRGRRLIEESIKHGVTAMRAFVEVDNDVHFKCLEAALNLKKDFERTCTVQICVFAQLPLFSGEGGGDAVRNLLSEAAKREGVDVLGSTPYVESDKSRMGMNVQWISTLALDNEKFLDLHMDYHLDKSKEPFIWDALELIKETHWLDRNGKGITMGHCTRLTQFEKAEWQRLKQTVGDLPVSFVGLPTSDLFMMRTENNVRGTLHVPKMIQEHGFQAAFSVNNIGNAFTPQGNCDPLTVASLGVGIYQAGTKKDTEILYQCVSTRAKAVIGLGKSTLDLKPGDPADFIIFGSAGADWKNRKSVAEVVYDAGSARTTVKDGRITSQ
ncbi:uncharacterized protein K452DRAFT_233837 [Aplosporella prunicola CBS 121167]|uniref:Amidohydrolase-related domain-containing protein n=1 Tax=Aplosporella prunicola CBS 121167 TaxID=1176127 RepID=A0A6A6B5G0_9PEZI|nr:uncharacterized protein K452DRAFT_233837 [Aplosporella prunicola CBS 121167]KAF2138515.1 hypothetical protein K452DRAFT_233837 [Aplosporella prunicola CBS 121167]